MTAQAISSNLALDEHFSHKSVKGSINSTGLACELHHYSRARAGVTKPSLIWKTGVISMGDYVVYYLPRVWNRPYIYKALKKYGMQSPTHYSQLQQCFPYVAPGELVNDKSVWDLVVSAIYADSDDVPPPPAVPRQDSPHLLAPRLKIVRNPGRSLRWDESDVHLPLDYPSLFAEIHRPEWLMVLTAYNHVMDLTLSPEFLHSIGIGWSHRNVNGKKDCVSRLVIQLPRLLAYLTNSPIAGCPFQVVTQADRAALKFMAENAKPFSFFKTTAADRDARSRFTEYQFKYQHTEKHARSMLERRLVVPFARSVIPDGAVASRYQLHPEAVPLDWFNNSGFTYPADDTVYIIPLENLYRDLPSWKAMTTLYKNSAVKNYKTVNGKRVRYNTVSHEFRLSSGDQGIVHPSSPPIIVKSFCSSGTPQKTRQTASLTWVSIPQELFDMIDPTLVVSFDPDERMRGYRNREGVSVAGIDNKITPVSLYEYLQAQYGDTITRRFKLHLDETSQEVYFSDYGRQEVRKVLVSGTVPNNTVVDQFMAFANDLFRSPDKANQALIKHTRRAKTVKLTGKHNITHAELEALQRILREARAINAKDSSYSLDWSDKDWELLLNQEPFVSEKRTRKTVERFMLKYNRKVIRTAAMLVGPTLEERLKYIEQHRIYKYAPAITKDVLKQFLITYAATGHRIGDYAKTFRPGEFERMLEAYKRRMSTQEKQFAALKAKKDEEHQQALAAKNVIPVDPVTGKPVVLFTT